MELKRHNDFINESKNKQWVVGIFTVDAEMVKDGKFIEGKIPDVVTSEFTCSDLGLTTLEGGPFKVNGDYYCNNNKLTDLKGSPSTSRYFICDNNALTTLEGSPIETKFGFHCKNNKLTSLKGGPKIVGLQLYVDNNELTSLEGAPLKVGGNITTEGNASDLSIERNFIWTKNRTDNYWIELLNYCVSKGYDLNTSKVNWPKGFLTDSMIKSAKGISKYKL